MGRPSSICVKSLVGIGGSIATGDENIGVFFMYVFLSRSTSRRGLDIQQRITSPFVDQFQRCFHCFLQKETGFPTICGDLNYITRWRHNFRRNRQFFLNVKPYRKIRAHDFDHLGARQHIIKVPSGLCSYKSIDVHLYNFLVTTSKVLKSVQVMVKSGRRW